MKLSRKWARACILLMIIGVCVLIIGTGFSNMWLVYGGGALLMFALAVKILKIRCPYCILTSVKPQWSKSGTILCPHCGKPIEYDDE